MNMSKLKREYTTLRVYHSTKQRLLELRPDDYNYSQLLDLLMDVYKGREQ